MTKDSSISTKACIGVLFVTIVTYVAGATTPALAILFAQFAEYPQWLVSMISTITSLGTVVGVLMFGAVANGKMKFKTIATIGMLTAGVFGILPTFLNQSLMLILVLRLVQGWGIGFIMSLGATWFLRSVRDVKERGKWVSWNQAVGSFGAVLFTLLGGWLADIQWNYCFLSFGLMFVAWVIVLVLFKEPKSIEEIIAEEGVTAGKEFEQAKRVRIPGIAWFIIIALTVYQILLSQGLNLLAVVMDMTGAGTASMVGVMLSVFCVVTAVVCVFGGQILNVLKSWASPIALLCLAVGMVVEVVATTIPMFMIAVILFGVGACILAFANFEMSLVNSPAGLAWGAVLIMVGSNLGNVLSSFVLGALQAVGGENVYFPIQFAAVGFLVLAAVYFFVVRKAWIKKDAKQ